jgi:hypothetical protein
LEVKNMSEKIIKTIEINCPPMSARPDTFIEGVIKDTGLELKEPCAKCFGNWTWDYSEVSDEKWLSVQPILAERLTQLYEDSVARYVSW